MCRLRGIINDLKDAIFNEIFWYFWVIHGANEHVHSAGIRAFRWFEFGRLPQQPEDRRLPLPQERLASSAQLSLNQKNISSEQEC
jgi:hypothetical protein